MTVLGYREMQKLQMGEPVEVTLEAKQLLDIARIEIHRLNNLSGHAYRIRAVAEPSTQLMSSAKFIVELKP